MGGREGGVTRFKENEGERMHERGGRISKESDNERVVGVAMKRGR